MKKIRMCLENDITFASRLRASEFNGSEHLIQEFMGHKSERETNDYMHISESEFASATARIGTSKSKVDTVLEFIRLQGLNASDILELSLLPKNNLPYQQRK